MKNAKRIIPSAIVTAGAAATLFLSGNETFFKYVVMPLSRLVPAHTLYKAAHWSCGVGFFPKQMHPDPPGLRVTFLGQKLNSPIGLPSGIDRTGEAVVGMEKLGFSTIEIGSVTPFGRRRSTEKLKIYRFYKDKALINIDNGYNNRGYTRVYNELVKLRNSNKSLPLIGVSLLSTQKDINVFKDFTKGVEKFAPLIDFAVIDLSSTQSPGFKISKNEDTLKNLLITVRATRESLPNEYNNLPIFIKFSPDLTESEFHSAINVIQSPATKVDGVIVCNSTQKRNSEVAPFLKRINGGGISGAPLKNTSTEMVKTIYKMTSGQIPILAAGGVFNGQDAYEKILAGATIVQLYSSMMFDGPPVVWKIKQELYELLRENGYKNVDEAIGAGVK